MTEVLETILSDWPERWRYPHLTTVLGSPGRSPNDLVVAMLNGLAEPVPDLATAISRLVADGETRAADDLLDDRLVTCGLTKDELDALHSEVRTAEQAAAADLDRRRHELLTRARQIDLSGASPAGLTRALGRRAELEALLGSWAAKINECEKEHENQLRSRLTHEDAANAPAWAAAVAGCLDAREFKAAEEILKRGPQGFESSGPAAAVRPSQSWAWPHEPLTGVLEWYADGTAANAGFNERWRPAADDQQATAMINAIRDLYAHVDEATVLQFVQALDGLLDVVGIDRDLDEVEGGFRTELVGLRDPRLPEDLLPSRMPLWLGPPGWTPPLGRPAIWFLFEPNGVQPPPGVAVLGPHTLFEIVAPDSGRHRSTAARRIHLLRSLYRQLDLTDLVGPGISLRLDDSHRIRTRIGWLFDLLGVAVDVDGAVLETLIYDTSGHPVGMRAALDALVGVRERRPRRISAGDLARWRTDLEAMSLLQSRIREGLDDQSLVVLASLLLLGAETPNTPFTPDTVSTAVSLVISADTHQQQRTVKNPLDVPAALQALTVTGWVVPIKHNYYELGHPGLITLLRNTDWTDAANEAFARITNRLTTVLKSIHVELSRRAILHWIKNDLEALYVQLDGIESSIAELPPDLRDLWTLLAETIRRLQEAQRISEEDIRERLVSERIDVRQLLDELVTAENRYQRFATVSLAADPGPVIVKASHFLVINALRNLITNALQATRRSDHHGQVHVQMCRLKDSSARIGRWVVIDILDSGSGFATEDRARFMRGEAFTNRGGGEGKGLAHARAQIDYSGGTLDVLPVNSSLGGAHVRVRLPEASEGQDVT